MGTKENETKTLDNIFLLRCIVTKVCNGYFEAKDYNGKKYIIKKNEATKKFKEGTDSTFYATKKVSGWFLKEVILYPLTSKEYEKLTMGKNDILVAIDEEKD